MVTLVNGKVWSCVGRKTPAWRPREVDALRQRTALDGVGKASNHNRSADTALDHCVAATA